MAILLVITVHAFHYHGTLAVGRVLDQIASAGWTGVTLFFVLSGFLITGILLDTKGKPNYFRDFIARRSLRIFPLYYAFLAVYFLVVPNLPYLASRIEEPPLNLRIYYWTYLSNMIQALSGVTSTPHPLDPLWSLAVEEQIYFVWPFLIAFAPVARLPAIFISLGLVSFGWRLGTRITAQSIEMSYAWAVANLEAFCAGALVAWITRFSSRTLLNLWARTVLLASAFFIGGMIAGQRHFSFWHGPVQVLTVGSTALSALFAAVIGCCITENDQFWLNRYLSAKWLCQFGRYSYAMYITHGCIIALVSPTIVGTREGSLGSSLFLAAVVILLSLAIALMSSRLLEQPFLRLKRFFPLSGDAVPHN